MKVLHLVSGDLTGGAARGAYWLHLALQEQGVNSNLLTNIDKDYEDDHISGLKETTYDWFQSRVFAKANLLAVRLYPKRENWIFNIGLDGLNFTNHQAYKDADIIHLHWINSFVSIQSLKKIKKPVVWTLRDMWPFTGGCHYSMNCDQYQNGCGHCQQLNSGKKWDVSRLVNLHKKRSLPEQLNLVGISNWITDCAKESEVFKNSPIRTISNNISDKNFYPIEQFSARKSLGLPTNKKIILIGAHQISNFYKGFDLFLKSLKDIEKEGKHLLLFGSISDVILEKINLDYTSLGFIDDDEKLRLAYSAADVFVAPSRMDAFGKTLAEAQACGTPVVCFDATGPKDIVKHEITGYKARPFDPYDFARGINGVLNLSIEQKRKMRLEANGHATNNFSSRIIARQYQELYEELLNSSQKTVKNETRQRHCL